MKVLIDAVEFRKYNYFLKFNSIFCLFIIAVGTTYLK